jgi:hypothetical protein
MPLHPSPARVVGAQRILLVALASLSLACPKSEIEVTQHAGPLPRPDVILVRDFAVTSDDVKLDKGITASIGLSIEGVTESEEQVRVGRQAADQLAAKIVDALNERGIHAARGRGRPVITPNTVILIGEFLTVDQGSRAARLVVGFGLGGTELRTRIEAYRAGQRIAAAETLAASGAKPGAAVTLGMGAAAGTAATAAAVAAGTATASEVFSANVEADIRRTADAIADQIRDAYRERGWL